MYLMERGSFQQKVEVSTVISLCNDPNLLYSPSKHEKACQQFFFMKAGRKTSKFHGLTLG